MIFLRFSKPFSPPFFKIGMKFSFCKSSGIAPLFPCCYGPSKIIRSGLIVMLINSLSASLQRLLSLLQIFLLFSGPWDSCKQIFLLMTEAKKAWSTSVFSMSFFTRSPTPWTHIFPHLLFAAHVSAEAFVFTLPIPLQIQLQVGFDFYDHIPPYLCDQAVNGSIFLGDSNFFYLLHAFF